MCSLNYTFPTPFSLKQIKHTPCFIRITFLCSYSWRNGGVSSETGLGVTLWSSGRARPLPPPQQTLQLSSAEQVAQCSFSEAQWLPPFHLSSPGKPSVPSELPPFLIALSLTYSALPSFNLALTEGMIILWTQTWAEHSLLPVCPLMHLFCSIQTGRQGGLSWESSWRWKLNC